MTSLLWSSTDRVASRHLAPSHVLVLQVLQLELSLRLLHVGVRRSYSLYRVANRDTGPFELTKLSAQISVLMAKSTTSSMDDPVRGSYQRKGTFRTAKSIVLNRGVGGLYSGFSLHLREY